MFRSDIEYKILRSLESNPNLTQREIAQLMDMSLGKTNYVVRSLIDKGWLKINNFQRSDNKLSYLYLLTPKGLVEKSELAQSFLLRKRQEYERLAGEIAELMKESD